MPPDVNRSGDAFTVEATPQGAAIRYALAAVKGVGAQAMQLLVEQREAHGRFADLFDFARRLDPRGFNRRQFESLVKAGAFDGLNRNRAQTFAAIELLLRHAAAAASERTSQQVNLFGGAAGQALTPALPRATIGSRSSGCSTSSRRSASISRAIRSTLTRAASRAWASCALPICRRGSRRAA